MAREHKAMRLTDNELNLLDDALSMEVSEIPMRMRFTVKTTEADKTYEQQRMNMLSLSQVFAQYAQQTVPLATQIYGPQGVAMRQQTPEAWNYMARILTGSGKLMEKIFEFFGINDTDNYIPDPSKLDERLDATAASALSQAFTPSQPGAVPSQGMPPEAAQLAAMQGGIHGPKF